MDFEQIKQFVADGQTDEIEAAWIEAVDAGEPVEPMAAVLEAMVDADLMDAAETLAWTLLEERMEQLPPREAVDTARAMVAAVPASDQLRTQAADLYRQMFAEHEHFDDILRASGLTTGQSARRAFRTLDVCLNLEPGDFLAGRYEPRVLKVDRFNPVVDGFDLLDASARTVQMEAKKLADEFAPAEGNDFRVLYSFRREELTEMLADDPAGVLVGICMSHGGRIDSDDLKDALVGDCLPPGEWSKWWSRARTAAKRCEQLALEGRSPVTVSYHPQGRRLEDELDADAARMPDEKLELLRTYAREARQRQVETDPQFAAPIVESLATQAREFAARRPLDALTAALAVRAAGELALPAPSGDHPDAAELLAGADDPVALIAQLDDRSLWPGAMEAMAYRDDAAAQLARLMLIAPPETLDELTRLLKGAGDGEAIGRAISDALSDPVAGVGVLAWLWKGPTHPPADTAAPVDLLVRLLQAADRVQHDWHIEPEQRKEVCREVRSALSSQDFARFREVVDSVDEGVAATLRRRVQRCEGLGEAVPDQMLAIVRERFPKMFVTERTARWADENVIWTTEAGRDARQAELKELLEVKLPANSRAIGEAASHGDLSENSEWKFAQEERQMMQSQAAKMQDELSRARVIRAEDVPEDSVGVGSRVTLVSLDDGREAQMSFLGPWDADVENRVYSYKTALGQSLMGKSVGETVTVKVDGVEGAYRIAAVAPAVE